MPATTVSSRLRQFAGGAAFLLASILLTQACRKPELEPADTATIDAVGGAPTAPTVLTVRVERTAGNDTVRVVGEVVRHGNTWISSRGLWYGTDPDPSTGNGDTIPLAVLDATGIGEFTVEVPLDTVFGRYVRAYAKNNAGIAYGEARRISGVQVFTDSVSGLNDVSGVVHARVIGSAQTRGIWYSSLTTDPTEGGDLRVSGSGPGSFSVTLTNLTPGTRYHVRAYAQGESGEAIYGDTLWLRTKLCPDSIRDASGYWYPVVEIGGRCWMAENLRTGKCQESAVILVSDGLGGTTWSVDPTDQIPPFSGNPPTGWSTDNTVKRCNHPGSQSTNSYGLLYNWYAAIDARKICPSGWELPSRSDWEQLVDSLGGDDVAGLALKAEDPVWDGSNNSGFNAPPAGSLNSPLGFSTLDLASWWTSTSASDSSAYQFTLTNNNASVFDDASLNWHGRSVRCIMSIP